MKPYPEYKETGLPWLPKIPKHWEIVKIRELFAPRNQKVSDKEFPPLSVSKGGVVPQIETVAKTQNGEDRKLVRTGDFVINSRSDRKGSSGISAHDGSVSLINIVLEPRGETVGRYWHYLLKSALFVEEFYRNGRGIVADLWTTRLSEMKSISLPVPPVAEQEQIVRYLDVTTAKINKLIAAKKKQIALLQEQKQAIINHAVTKGLNPSAEMKPSGIDWLGPIPKHWEVKALKYFADSNLASLGQDTDMDLSFDYLDIASVGFGCLRSNPEKMRFSDSPSRARRLVQLGDTIISTVRTYLRSICFVDESLKDCVVSTGFSVLHPKKNVLPQILNYALSTDAFINAVIQNSIGVSYPAIADSRLIALKIALPPSIEEQEQIVAHIRQKTLKYEVLQKNKEKEIELLLEHRDSLASAIITGQMKVPGNTLREIV